MILRRISTPFSKYRVFVYLFCIAGIAAAALFLPMLFGLAPLPLEVLAEAAIVIVAAEVLFYFVSEGVVRILKNGRRI